jgi:hypothetical protein
MEPVSSFKILDRWLHKNGPERSSTLGGKHSTEISIYYFTL